MPLTLDTLPRAPRRRGWVFTGLRRLLACTAAPCPGVDGLVHGRASRPPRAVEPVRMCVCVSVGSGELVCSPVAPVRALVDGFVGIPEPFSF